MPPLWIVHRDPRLRAAVLAFGGGGFGPEAVDPVRYVGDVSPRPLLFIQSQSPVPAPGMPAIPRSAAIALHEAAREPKWVEWRAESDLEILDSAWEFLSPILSGRERARK